MKIIGILLAFICTFSYVKCKSDVRIINGIESVEPHPWICRVIIDITSQGIASDCGCSLVADDWVLTAKHCLLNNKTEELGKVYYVSIGKNNWLHGQIIKVTHHYFYSKEHYNDHDIVLMKLESSPKNIKPIKMQLDDIIYDGELATIYGWGLTDPTNTDSQTINLRETKVKLHTQYCILEYCILQCDADLLCFDPTNTNTNSCEGDSGGPMTLMVNGEETLVGVSHDSQVVDGVPCTGQYSSYTKTFYKPYAEWIKNTINTK